MAPRVSSAILIYRKSWSIRSFTGLTFTPKNKMLVIIALIRTKLNALLALFMILVHNSVPFEAISFLPINLQSDLAISIYLDLLSKVKLFQVIWNKLNKLSSSWFMINEDIFLIFLLGLWKKLALFIGIKAQAYNFHAGWLRLSKSNQ